MSIKSDAFGRVTLTNEDAKKFVNQVKYGRPKKNASDAVKNGLSAVREFQTSGQFVIKAKRGNSRLVKEAS